MSTQDEVTIRIGGMEIDFFPCEETGDLGICLHEKDISVNDPMAGESNVFVSKNDLKPSQF